MILKFRAWHEQGFMLKAENIVKLNLEDKILEYCVVNEDGDRSDRECYFDELVLMQSTGLKDKNGKEIFWGDIVEVSKGFTNIICYSVNEGNWKLRPVDKQWACSYFSNYENTDEWEIIGNIYENQELKGE